MTAISRRARRRLELHFCRHMSCGSLRPLAGQASRTTTWFHRVGHLFSMMSQACGLRSMRLVQARGPGRARECTTYGSGTAADASACVPS